MVRAGQFAEVRATFPIDWVPGLAPSGEPRLELSLIHISQLRFPARSERDADEEENGDMSDVPLSCLLYTSLQGADIGAVEIGKAQVQDVYKRQFL